MSIIGGSTVFRIKYVCIGLASYYKPCMLSGHAISPVAHALPGFGGGNGSTLIDNAACSGHEERLEDCVHNGIGINNCPPDHSHNAGVFCDPSELIHVVRKIGQISIQWRNLRQGTL